MPNKRDRRRSWKWSGLPDGFNKTNEYRGHKISGCYYDIATVDEFVSSIKKVLDSHGHTDLATGTKLEQFLEIDLDEHDTDLIDDLTSVTDRVTNHKLIEAILDIVNEPNEENGEDEKEAEEETEGEVIEKDHPEEERPKIKDKARITIVCNHYKPNYDRDNAVDEAIMILRGAGIEIHIEKYIKPSQPSGHVVNIKYGVTEDKEEVN